MTQILNLGEQDYKHITEIVFRDPETGALHVKTWFCTASSYERDPYRYGLAIRCLMALLGWEFVSFSARKLRPEEVQQMATAPKVGRSPEFEALA